MTTYSNSLTIFMGITFSSPSFINSLTHLIHRETLDASEAKVLMPSLQMEKLGSGCKVFCGLGPSIPPSPTQRPMGDAGKPRCSPGLGFLSPSFHPKLELSLKCAGSQHWHPSSKSKFFTSQFPGKSAVYRATKCAEAPRRLEAMLTSDQLLLRVSQSEK